MSITKLRSGVHINNHFGELTDAVKFMLSLFSEETKITNFKTVPTLSCRVINDEST